MWYAAPALVPLLERLFRVLCAPTDNSSLATVFFNCRLRTLCYLRVEPKQKLLHKLERRQIQNEQSPGL